MSQTLVVIPTYNEADNIGSLIDALNTYAPDVDILVVDDASPDGTGAVADKYAERSSAVHVFHRAAKDGLGEAYRTGFTWGLQRDYRWFVEMDADGSHRPADLHRLRNAAYAADLVIGSRWIPGGRVVDWSPLRRFISRTGTFYAQAMLGLPVRDATAGFRVLSRRAIEAIQIEHIASQGYCFQIDVARRIRDAGLTITEVPVTFVERQHGASKMSAGIVVEALWRVTLWGLTRFS